jgi:hypothetical protein
MAKLTLADFTGQLTKAFGDDLSAVVLYGSAVGRTDPERGSDRNILVVVKTLRPAALRSAAAATGAWQKTGNPAPLILTEAEWRSSRDVFAMEHADIGARHEVLAGAFPTAPAPETADLRRQLEFEAMGALIHLRQGILACASDLAMELKLLAASKGTVLVLFRALLRVHGEPVPAEAEAVIDAVAARVGFDPAPFRAVVAHVRGTKAIAKGEADAVLTAYHDGLKRFVAHVDAMVHPDSPAVN